MSFTVVFSNGEPRDYGVFDSFEITDAGVLLIRMQRQDVSRHYVAPGGWLEVVEMTEAGKLSVRVARSFPLDQAADAQRLLAEGHSGGKIVLTVA